MNAIPRQPTQSLTDDERQQRIIATMSNGITVNKGWIARMPRLVRKGLEWILIAFALGCIIYQLYRVRVGVLESALAMSPPIEFIGLLEPDKTVYAPGDTIRFTYHREVLLPDGEKEPLFAVSMDCFEEENGVVYPGETIGRLIPKAGVQESTAVRRVPTDALDGVYVFQGWMQAQTYRRSVPVAYKSRPFRVQKALTP